MIRFRRAGDPHMLAVSMAGIKMGDRMVQVGCAHGDRLGAIASKVGLSGHAVAVVPDEASAARAQKGAAKAGVLVEVSVAPPGTLPLGASAFDLAIIDNTDGLLSNASVGERATTVRELFRVVRPGGRLIVVSAAPPSGLGALFARTPAAQTLDLGPILLAEGFKTVRVLAERDGLHFVEGLKPREHLRTG